jgi:hypothetical protein
MVNKIYHKIFIIIIHQIIQIFINILLINNNIIQIFIIYTNIYIKINIYYFHSIIEIFFFLFMVHKLFHLFLLDILYLITFVIELIIL